MAAIVLDGFKNTNTILFGQTQVNVERGDVGWSSKRLNLPAGYYTKAGTCTSDSPEEISMTGIISLNDGTISEDICNSYKLVQSKTMLVRAKAETAMRVVTANTDAIYISHYRSNHDRKGPVYLPWACSMSDAAVPTLEKDSVNVS